MKTFNKCAAQGDVMFRRVDELPTGLVRVEPEGPGHTVVVTHSETGHHHVMCGDTVEMYRPEKDFDWDAWLVVTEPTALHHLRQHDTHESIMFEPGVYHARRQREYVPEGFRRVED
jgi:hypothetical protein